MEKQITALWVAVILLFLLNLYTFFVIINWDTSTNYVTKETYNKDRTQLAKDLTSVADSSIQNSEASLKNTKTLEIIMDRVYGTNKKELR